MTAFSSTDYSFSANRTLPANAALGIWNVQDFAGNAGVGIGGNDTATIQATINAATPTKGVAFLPPAPSGQYNVTIGSDGNPQSLILPPGVSLVGAAPGVVINVLAASNLDWIVSTGAWNTVDYRTNFVVNYRSQTLASNPYTTFDPAHPAALAVGGGMYNVTFNGNVANQSSGLGHGVMLNAATAYTLSNVNAINCGGEGASLWDCSYISLQQINGSVCGRVWAFHRASYAYSVVGSTGQNCTNPSFSVQTEEFQVPNGPLLTLTPEYGKFVACHHYATTEYVSGFDLGGPAFAALVGVSADNISGSTAYHAVTKDGAVPYAVTSA